MESIPPKRRFPPPWRAIATDRGYIVKDANGVTLVNIYHRQDIHSAGWSFAPEHLTADEARRIAKGIARLPELLTSDRRAFVERGSRRYWKRSHPYHVALEDSYVQENYDWIVATCSLNGVSFDATGEILERGVRYRSYQFALQLHAIQFWDRFDGRWLFRDEFVYPDRPTDLPKLKEPPEPNKFGRSRRER